MTKFSQKSLAVFLAILTFFLINSAFADEIKTNSETQKIHEANDEDPDLKLSIEDLRKKYPIEWLKEKYGDDFCPGYEFFIAAGYAPKNFVGVFFSVEELKSVFVHVNFNSDDERTILISGLTFQYFEDKPNKSLSKKEKKLKKFIYSKQVIAPFEDKENCANINDYFDLKSLPCSSHF